MAYRFKAGYGDWTQYRQLPNCIEVDFHNGGNGPRNIPYWQAMDNVYAEAMEVLRQASEKGLEYVIFRHGYSTSRNGRTTARSVIRGLMRSREATPYIVRRECIQHYAVFVAAIKPNARRRMEDESRQPRQRRRQYADNLGEMARRKPVSQQLANPAVLVDKQPSPI